MATRISSAYVTALLAEFVAGTEFEDLPERVRHTATKMVLDTVGVSIAGAADPAYATISTHVAAVAGRGDVPSPASRPLDVLWAAFTGGVAAHLLDYDDFHSTIGGHPSAPLLPVVFSLGYSLRASGAATIRAFALGAEVEARIGAGINPAHYSIGWHPTSVIGSLGACAAAASLLNLDADAVRRAFGLAASHACGTKANFGTLTKSVHVGVAARSGLESALLAQVGATANDHILDEQFGGYCELFSSSTDRSRILEKLGDKYLIVDPGVGMKLLPCCGSTQGAVWGMIGLKREHGFAPERIREVRTWLDKRRIPHTNRPDVRTGLEGKFSAQYCQAVAALRGTLGLGDFEAQAVLQPDRQALMKRIHLNVAPDADCWPDADDPTGAQGARVEVELDDGTIHQSFTPCPRGYPSEPASDADQQGKFLDCASRGLNSSAARVLLGQLLRLESMRDIAPLVEQTWAGVIS